MQFKKHRGVVLYRDTGVVSANRGWPHTTISPPPIPTAPADSAHQHTQHIATPHENHRPAAVRSPYAPEDKNSRFTTPSRLHTPRNPASLLPRLLQLLHDLVRAGGRNGLLLPHVFLHSAAAAHALRAAFTVSWVPAFSSRGTLLALFNTTLTSHQCKRSGVSWNKMGEKITLRLPPHSSRSSASPAFLGPSSTSLASH